MRHVARRALALVPVCLGLVVAAAAGPAGAAYVRPAPQRILVVGDSLSQGWGGDWTWRNWLWREVVRQHAAVDFVGPYRGPAHGTRYERTWSWDSDHAAVSGSTIEDHQDRIAGEMSTYAPDVLVVELGHNDVSAGDSASTVADELERLIDTAWGVRPSAKVLLAQLPNIGSAARDAKTAEINGLMASWARGKPVTIVQNRTAAGMPWDPVKYTFDTTHPNATGQTLLAYRMAQALHVAGVLPSWPASTLYQERVWSPDPQATVSRSGNTVTVEWATLADQIRFDDLRVYVDGRAGAWLAKGAGHTTLSVPSGSHRIQVALKRGRMTSTPGVAVTT